MPLLFNSNFNPYFLHRFMQNHVRALLKTQEFFLFAVKNTAFLLLFSEKCCIIKSVYYFIPKGTFYYEFHAD